MWNIWVQNSFGGKALVKKWARQSMGDGQNFCCLGDPQSPRKKTCLFTIRKQFMRDVIVTVVLLSLNGKERCIFGGNISLFRYSCINKYKSMYIWKMHYVINFSWLVVQFHQHVHARFWICQITKCSIAELDMHILNWFKNNRPQVVY